MLSIHRDRDSQYEHEPKSTGRQKIGTLHLHGTDGKDAIATTITSSAAAAAA